MKTNERFNILKNTFRYATGICTMLVSLTFAPLGFARTITLPFDSANFVAGQPINNKYFPLMPGTTYVYEAEEDEYVVRTETTVTQQKEMVAGVECIVVHDVQWVLVEGVGMVKLEDTFDWYAQDIYGHVWYFGEDTLAYLYDEAWNLVGTTPTGSWKAEVADASAGIIMLADPRPGFSYQQEFAEDVAEDMARVLRNNDTVSICFGDFTDCLVTKEWTPLERGAVEQKFYAPGIGLVLVKELSGGKTVFQELVDIVGSA